MPAAGARAVVHTTDPRTFHALVAPADARELARTRFARLDRAGRALRSSSTPCGPGSPSMADGDRTAALLGVHPNTVRHRLARVADLLDVDLLDVGLQGPGARMELWFALQWLPGEAPHKRH